MPFFLRSARLAATRAENSFSDSISKTSGLAGIAYWINQTYGLEGDDMVSKRDELVVQMKEKIDAEYEDGRQTVMTDRELDEMIQTLAPGRYQMK